jgi:acyl-CoA synthetase (AMP-forming)/AMP-acid ligase II
MTENADAGWPAMTLAEATAQLCAPGAAFEMEVVDVGGIPTRAWKNALPNLAALARHARGHAHRTFMICEDERISYAGWYRATAQLANELQRSGVMPGTRIAIAMRNLPEWPVAYFAAVAIGAVVVPLNAWWTAAELGYGLRDSGASVLIADGERYTRLASAGTLAKLDIVLVSRPDAPLDPSHRELEAIIGRPSEYGELPEVDLPDLAIASDQTATIFYTSGTSGPPKGVLGTHRMAVTNILSSAFSAARSALRRGAVPAGPISKVVLLSIPFFHVTGCNARLLGSMWNGDTLVLLRKWDVREALELIEREGVNNAGGVPTIAWQLLEHPDRTRFDLRTLESISYGGAPAAPELVRRIWEEFGAMPGYGWGMTETAATVTHFSGEDYLAKPSSAGPAVAVADLKIVDPESLAERATGEIGELWAKGPMVAREYWGKVEESALTFREGWVRSGDLAYLDADGFLFIVDRLKDMVIRGGENIYSIEVENALFSHPAVVDAALIGLPHRTLGEVPAAYVHLAKGAEVSQKILQTWVGDRLAAFKVPVLIFFSDALLPRNANGKILKSELLRMAQASENSQG